MSQILQNVNNVIKNLKLERKKELTNSVKKQSNQSSPFKKKVLKAK